MIKVNYAGEFPGNTSLGNKLFQYAFGRILAEKYNRQLVADAIPGFPGAVPLGGEIMGGTPYKHTGHILHEDDLPHDRPWHLSGYYQRYEYYRPYKEKIRQWYAHNMMPWLDKTSICLHYRLGDFVQDNFNLPVDFVISLIDDIKHLDRVVFIVTDDPKHKIIKTLTSYYKYASAIHHDKEIDDLKFIMYFNEVWLSQSTFSWWAAWLGHAKRVLFPVTKTGYWSDERPEIDLWVDDEDRYKKVYL